MLPWFLSHVKGKILDRDVGVKDVLNSEAKATESSSHRVAYVYIEPQKQKNLGWLGYIERALVPGCTGIVRSQYKDPQKLISILGCKTVLFQR